MGRLTIFNRKIPLAPDDVYIPAAYGFVLHSVWLASTAVVYAVVRNDCGVDPSLINFLLVLIGTLCLQVPLDTIMIALSMSGTVARKGPRRYVGAFVQISCFVLVFELALECYGIFVTYGPKQILNVNPPSPSCPYPIDSSSAALIHMVVVWSFIAIVFYFVGLGLFLLGSASKSKTKAESYMRVWQKRLNFIMGTGGLVDSDVLQEVAGELATYFKDFDWAPSDVAVGLLLLKREQKKITEIRQARRLLIEQPDGFWIPTLESNQIREELATVQKEEETTSKRMTWINGGKLRQSNVAGKMKLFKGLSLRAGASRENLKLSVAKGFLSPRSSRDNLRLADQAGEAATKDKRFLALEAGPAGAASSSPVLGNLLVPLVPSHDTSAPQLMRSSPEMSADIDKVPEPVSLDLGSAAIELQIMSKRNTQPDTVIRIENDEGVDRNDKKSNDAEINPTSEGNSTDRNETNTRDVGLGVTFANTVTQTTAKSPAGPLEAEYRIPINDLDTDDNSDVDDAKAKTGKKIKQKFSMGKIKSPSIPFNFKAPGMQRTMSFQQSRQSKANQRKPALPHFTPFKFRRNRAFSGHRSVNQTKQQGSLHREEIDDILHFARFAEVVYTPEEINMIYSDRLHFHSNDNGIYRSPYLIVHDVETDSIVIAIRGTYSATDVLVDLKFDVVQLEIPGFEEEEEHLAHVGFMTTARNIVGDIKRLNILAPLLNEPGSEFFGCSLVVTGHSLGAGVAALVANILRQDFPSTCCYAYEPPGCVVSSRAAEYFESFCTSVVMGDDVVTRLSRNTLEMLKLDLDRHLTNCNEPKWKVIGSVLGSRICCTNTSRRSKKGDGGLGRPGLLHRRTPSGHLDPADLAIIKRRTNSLRVGKDNRSYDVALPTVPMYLPGKILHIEKLRRPPLNFNQVINRQIAKVTDATKAVSRGLKAGAEGVRDLVYEGAELMKDGVAEITEFAGDVKDIILDQADMMKDRIVGDKKPASSGAPGSSSKFPGDGNAPVDASIPLNDGDGPASGNALKPRSSLGDILMARTRSSRDTRLKQRGTAERLDLLPSANPDQTTEKTSPRVAFISSDNLPLSESVDEISRKGRSRRSERRMRRARSSGNVGPSRSRSVGGDGYDTNVDLASSDEEISTRRKLRVSVKRKSSRRDKEEGALTDSEVFSDTELADLGGRRINNRKPSRRSPVRANSGDDDRVFRLPKLITNLTPAKGPRSVESPESPSRIHLNPDQIVQSKKPRAHKEAIPSESITGKYVTPGATQLTGAITSPYTVDGEASPVAEMNPVIIEVIPETEEAVVSAPLSPSDNPLTPPVKSEPISSPDSNVPREEPEIVPVNRTAGVTFKEPLQSVKSREDVLESKAADYANSNRKQSIQKGPNTNGKYHYVPRWARKEEFQEIIVSRSMIADHSPFELLREFQAAPAGSVLGVVTRD